MSTLNHYIVQLKRGNQFGHAYCFATNKQEAIDQVLVEVGLDVQVLSLDDHTPLVAWVDEPAE